MTSLYPVNTPAPLFAHMSTTPQTQTSGNPAQRNLTIPQTHPAHLQSVFPNAYAHEIQPNALSMLLPNTSQALSTLSKLAPHKPVKDPEISNLEQTLKMGGSFLIATLATWGLRQRIMGIGEFLGFLSWFGAMAITPASINALVKLKTGADLSQMYASTYGERKNLYTDPNYLPLHIVPDAEIEQVANRLKIPPGPDRRRKTEEKLRQISVQSRTWWMLVAGPATPVLSGMACDLLQGPLTRRITKLRLNWGMRLAQKNLNGSPSKLTKQVEKNIDRIVGDYPDAMLTTWWQDFGRGLLNHTGLRTEFSIKEMTNGSPEFQLQKMLLHFEKMQSDPKRLDNLERYLNWQSEQLKKLEKRAFNALEPFEKGISPADWQDQYRFMQRRISNARNTLEHYNVLLQALRTGKQSPQDIRILIEKPLLNEVQRLIENGYFTEAQRLTGNPDNYQKISTRLRNRQFRHAYIEMGASIDMHLRGALNAVGLRSLWRKRIPLSLGGGLLAATALYTSLFVGRNFKFKPPPQQQGEQVL